MSAFTRHVRNSATAQASAVVFAALATLLVAAATLAQPPTGVPSTVDAPAARFVGVGSCTSVGCHGGGRLGKIVGSEYNIWISRDPHARAYSMLFDERSQRMVRLLDKLPEGAAVAAHEDARCLACHSQVYPASVDLRPEIISDGVGCEACHGAAEHWLADHFTGRVSPAQLESQGMRNTKNLLVRAQMCAECHVGSPGRDVNHDLIAAGHPRLEFEMSAYLEAMPKHWDEAADRAQLGEMFDAAVWAIGQASTSQAAMNQLAERAAHGKTWPEFAEWSCSACHHDLRDGPANQLRQQNLVRADRLPGELMAWDTWNHYTTRDHAADLSRALGLDPALGSQVESNVQSIDEAMSQLAPDRQTVATQARDAATLLDGWSREIAGARFARPGLDRLSRAIVQRQLDNRVVDWSSAAQAYDALANLHQARLENSPGGEAQLTAAIRQMYDDLVRRQQQPASYEFQPEQMEEPLHTVFKLLPPAEGEP